VHFWMEFSEIYYRHMSMNIPINEWKFCTVGLGIPPVPVDEILAPVDLIHIIVYAFALYLKQRHKKCSFAQYVKEFEWIELWILKEIGQSAMRENV
jgi:hypothetical protein